MNAQLPPSFWNLDQGAPDADELIVDSFAGGGGASTGIEMALGRSPDYAINHDPEALALHAANHPETVHLSKNIYKVDPMDVVGRRKVGLLWASPDCKHFSKAKGGKSALVAAFLAQHNTMPGGGIHPGHSVEEPVSAVTATGSQQSVVSAGLMNMKGSDRRMTSVEEPNPTVTADGTHQAEVRAFLMKYYGVDQDPRLDEPLSTVTTRDRFGIVTVEGVDYEIVDIGMRMLRARELFNAQGFPRSYIIDQGLFDDGIWRPLTHTAQVRMCGNSVCPPIAAALVSANCADMARSEKVAAE